MRCAGTGWLSLGTRKLECLECADLNKDTDDNSYNYDGSSEKPRGVALVFPNLFSYEGQNRSWNATNIHHIILTGSYCACNFHILMKDPEATTLILIEALPRFPDFSNRWSCYGKSGIRRAYETVWLIHRAKSKIGKFQNGRERIIVHDPYMVI